MNFSLNANLSNLNLMDLNKYYDINLVSGNINLSTNLKGKFEKGKEVYKNVCASCHLYGTTGAATMIDFKFWDQSANKGMDIILKNVVEGYKGKLGVMPPKGNCLSCSDEDIKASIIYIFKEVLDNKTK